MSSAPTIPQPVATLGSLVYVCQALRQAVEGLTGQRGDTASNQAITRDDLISLGLLSANATTSNSPYQISEFTTGLLAANQLLVLHKFTFAVTFPINFGATPNGLISVGGALVNATGATVMSIQRCLAASDPTVGGSWTTIGTATVAAGGHAITLTTSGGAVVNFAQADVLRVVAPTSPDATLAAVFFSLVGTR